jgi:hypothetical protein
MQKYNDKKIFPNEMIKKMPKYVVKHIFGICKVEKISDTETNTPYTHSSNRRNPPNSYIHPDLGHILREIHR